MSAGFQVTLAAANNEAAQLAVNLRDTLEQVNQFQTWLSSVGSAGLEALGMVAADAAVMISAFNDLNDLFTIYSGNTSIHLTGTYQYTQFAKQLTAYS